MHGTYSGHIFGSCQLEEEIGKGGFADVYKAHHTQHRERVAAVKVFHTTLGEQQQREDQRRETENARVLQHPHIVRVFYSDIEHTPPFMIMELMECSLAQRHPLGDDATRPSLTTIATYVQAIADASQYAHGKGVAHLDVKPENMLVGFDGVVKLADFGIARPNRSLGSPTLSRVVGTPSYMAPEQLTGHATYLSDQYALAAVVYEWLSGRPVSSGLAVPLYQMGIAPALSAVVMRALAPEPRQRYGSVSEFAAAFIHEVRSTRIPRGTVLSAQTPHNAPTVADPSAQTPHNALTVADPSIYTPQISKRPTQEDELVKEQRLLLEKIHEWDSSAERDLQAIEDEHIHMRSQSDERAAEQNSQLQTRQESMLGRHGSLRRLQEELPQKLNAVQPAILQWGIRLLSNTKEVQRSSQPTLDACEDLIQQTGQQIDRFFRITTSTFYRVFCLLGALAVAATTGLIAFLLYKLFQVFPATAGNVLVLLLIGVFWLLITLCLIGYLLFRFIGQSFRTTVTTLNGLHLVIQDAYQRQLQQVEDERMQSHHVADRTYTDHVAQRSRDLRPTWADLYMSIEKYQAKVQQISPAWTDSLWTAWQLPAQATRPAARLGTFSIPLGEKVRALLQLPSEILLPALITYRPGFVMSIEAPLNERQDVKAWIVQGIEALIVRILTAQPERTIRFTVLDPSRWTDNLAILPSYALQDVDNIVGISRVWSIDVDIEEQLTQLIETLRATNTRSTPMSANKRIAHVLVILDFSGSFSAEQRRKVLNIIKNGSEHDISTLLVNDFRNPLPEEFRHSLEEWSTAVIIGQHQQSSFIWNDVDYQHYAFQFNSIQEVPHSTLEYLMNTVFARLQPATALEYNRWFNDQLRDRGSLPIDAAKGVQLFLGHTPSQQVPTTAMFHRQETNNLLLVRQDGQRKHTLSMLTNIMIGLIAQYPMPTTVRFFGLDLSEQRPEAYNGTHPFALVRQIFAAQGYIQHEADSVLENMPTKLVQFYNSLNDAWEDTGENATVNSIPTYIFVYDLPKLSSFSLKKATQQQKDVVEKIPVLLRTIMEHGNQVNMYVIMAYDLFLSSQAFLGNDTIPFFGHRVVSGAISSQLARDVLWRDTIPPNLEEGQAYLYSATSSSGGLERFYPYDFPSRAWVEWVAARI